ncbi:MAG: hypothetical protein QXP42_00810 [Candidatus Micrarchaeia archaeon]
MSHEMLIARDIIEKLLNSKTTERGSKIEITIKADADFYETDPKAILGFLKEFSKGTDLENADFTLVFKA